MSSQSTQRVHPPYDGWTRGFPGVNPFLENRKRFTDDRLRGPGLGSLEWAIALEEGWEMRYTYALEGGDGWAALHLLR